MAELRPFRAVRPQEKYAARIAALPYDVYSLEEARAEVAREPLSFLAVDLPETAAQAGEDLAQKAGSLLRERMEAGYFVQEETPCYYIYELTMDGRTQTGIGALARVDDYLNGTIRRHENTRADKEADRIAHVEGCRAQTGPIFLAYRAKEEIRALTEQVKGGEAPLFDVTGTDGVQHRIWRVADEEELEAFYDAFEAVDTLYIADGHHRCAAAVACAVRRREKDPDYDCQAPWNFILSVAFPDDELKILDYNRVVKDLNGLSQEEFLERVGAAFEIRHMGETVPHPAHKGEIGMYLPDGWYALKLRDGFAKDDPVEGLDVSLLQDLVLAPVLGIAQPRTDRRISFVGGIRGCGELKERVDREGGVAFLMYPTAIGELFAVADAGRLMPPKSTWFEPKLRSGFLISSFEGE